jgi:integrase
MKRTNVKIESTGNTLRLRWWFKGKRYSLSNGDSDNPIGWGMARQTAAQIINDCGSGYFDESLVKYRRRVTGPKAAEITVSALVNEFAAFKLKQSDISQRSLETRYQPLAIAVSRHLDIPCHKLTRNQALSFAKHCDNTLTMGTAKGRLWLLQSAWEWGQGRYDVGNDNPWEGLTDNVKTKSQRKPSKPFTLEEIAAIKATFSGSKYRDIVTLLFSTAARPGEIFGLRWMDVSEDFQTILIRNAVSRGVQTGTTKTGVERFVPLNTQASKVFRDRHNGQTPDTLVFTGVEGLPIKDTAFRSVWRRKLSKAGIEYRSPRTIRPTAVSWNRRNCADPVAFAEACGHSLRTQDEIYRRATESVSFMEF